MNALGQETSLSSKMVILSLINGMIGGLILILPVLSLKTGYVLSIIVICTAGFFSYYSCYLCMLHIDASISKHFNGSNKAKSCYEICICVSLLLIDILYFQLIILQWIGLVPPYYFTNANAVINAVVLAALALFMKYYQFGAKLMAYGIISIIVYLLFLTWVVADQSSEGTTNAFKTFSDDGIELFSAMGMGFSIQTFFIPVLKRFKDTKNHQKVLRSAYIVGAIVYLLIAGFGSYGIAYRSTIGYSDGQKTIESYFGTGTWQVNIIQLIYLIHLYSVFPQFLLISKKRFFNVFHIEQSPEKAINYKEIIYIAVFLIICLVIALLRVSMREIIDINGAVLGFIFIYLIPCVIHIKCMYFSRGKVPLGALENKIRGVQKYEVMIEEGNINLQTQFKKESEQEAIDKPVELKEYNQDQADSQSNNNKQQKIFQSPTDNIIALTIHPNQYECACDKRNYTLSHKILDGAIVLSMFTLGLYILIDTLLQLI